MKTIDCLLTPRIESENVKYDTLVSYPICFEKAIADENRVTISLMSTFSHPVPLFKIYPSGLAI